MPMFHFLLCLTLTLAPTCSPKSLCAGTPSRLVCRNVFRAKLHFGSNKVFAAVSSCMCMRFNILSAFGDFGAAVHLPVRFGTLPSSCSFKSPKTQMQSPLGTLVRTVCRSLSVSSWHSCVLPLCGIYTATAKMLHVGPFRRTQHTRSPSEPNPSNIFCARDESRMPTPAALSLGNQT